MDDPAEKIQGSAADSEEASANQRRFNLSMMRTIDAMAAHILALDAEIRRLVQRADSVQQASPQSLEAMEAQIRQLAQRMDLFQQTPPAVEAELRQLGQRVDSVQQAASQRAVAHAVENRFDAITRRLEKTESTLEALAMQLALAGETWSTALMSSLQGLEAKMNRPAEDEGLSESDDMQRSIEQLQALTRLQR
jgi:hypothetical protein